MKNGTNPLLGLSRVAKQRGRLLRRQARRAVALLQHQRLSLAGVPVLFANSFPKSGTHLLSQILDGFARLGPAVVSGLPVILTYDNFTGQRRPLQAILADLERFGPGDVGFGHLHAEPEIIQKLCQPNWVPFFIYRDPRDVVVSHVYYLSEMQPGHVHRDYYVQQLDTFEARLATSIRGLPESPLEFPDIAARFAPFLGWLEQPQVLALQFEALVSDPQAQIQHILQHALDRGFPLEVDRESAGQLLLDSIDPGRSPTFRSGKTGGWRQHFTPEITALFKNTAGELLIQLGYEDDDDW